MNKPGEIATCKKPHFSVRYACSKLVTTGDGTSFTFGIKASTKSSPGDLGNLWICKICR